MAAIAIPSAVPTASINQLIQDIARNDNEGIGKPKAPKHGPSGYWSRRITGEHRLVY